jgi:hypothetical protein
MRGEYLLIAVNAENTDFDALGVNYIIGDYQDHFGFLARGTKAQLEEMLGGWRTYRGEEGTSAQHTRFYETHWGFTVCYPQIVKAGTFDEQQAQPS